MNNYYLPLMDDNITRDDVNSIVNFLNQDQIPKLTNGPKVVEFENKWGEWLGTKYNLMVNSGASANELTMLALKHLYGDGEIIIPPLTWISDISSVIFAGFNPVFVDINLNNLSFDLDKLKKAITPDTRAIFLTHVLGINGLTEDLLQLCKEKNILLIEDVCESHGTTFNNIKVGNFGFASNFSFYFAHHMSTIEGGMICTNNGKIDELSKLFRSHGMTREVSEETQNHYKENYPELNPLFTFAVAGFNMRSTELNAVLGIEQMKRIDSYVEKRKHNLSVWLQNLDSRKYFTEFDVEGNSSFALPLIVRSEYKDRFHINDDFDSVCDRLDLRGVEYRLGTAGGGNQAIQPYLDNFPFKVVGDLDSVNYVHNNSLYIGNHIDLTDEQIINLAKLLNDV